MPSPFKFYRHKIYNGLKNNNYFVTCVSKSTKIYKKF